MTGGCYHWYIRPSSYILYSFFPFLGKRRRGEGLVCFLLCPWTTRRRHPPALLATSFRTWRALLVFRREEKNSTRLFERSPSSYICTYHIHWAMIRRKGVNLNCRRAPLTTPLLPSPPPSFPPHPLSPIHEQKNTSPSPHHVFPFFCCCCCCLIQELG